MPAMMKSIRQPSLEALTDARENPATDEKQHGNQDISQVYHGIFTSASRRSPRLSTSFRFARYS
jgi:hypothetical protein